ncbi:MAG: DUF2461 domain-containing protein [Acidimicrobiales bacterium]
MSFDGFGSGTSAFFEELAANNTRDWWLANKSRYEADVRAPLEYLLADLADEFGEAKVFRPNRDTRFSADKTPYKTAAAAVIGDVNGSASTLYVQISADGLTVGGGCYHPARDQLTRLREAIAADQTGRELEAIAADLERASGELASPEQLKTAPRGYAADHPRIELLRMKGIVAMFEHPPAPWLHTEKAKDTVATDWRVVGPLNAWLDANVGPSTLPDPRR